MAIKKDNLLRISMQFFAADGVGAGDTNANGATGGADTNSAGGDPNSTGADNNASGNNQPDNKQTDDNGDQLSNIEKLIQQAVDRATNKLGNDNKALRNKLEKLQKEKLTEDELKELEIKNKEAEIAQREAAILEKENRLYAIKAIKEAGLDDGSDMSLQLVDFVIADKTEDIDARVKTFNTLFKAFVKREVDKTFKDSGRNPNGGQQSAGDKEKKDNSIAAKLGKVAAETNKQSQTVLNHYLGGN